MNFAWEMAIKLANSPNERQNLFFKQATTYSSYYEQAFLCLNEENVKEQVIELNGLYRFDAIFGELLSPRLEACEELRTYLYDAVLHFLVEIDLYQGLCKRVYYSRKIQKEIIENGYGIQNQRSFIGFSQQIQRTISDYLLIQYKVGTSLLLFTKVIKAIFPEAITYQSTVDDKQILVYIGEVNDESNQSIMDFLINSFLPLSFYTRLFWKHHFGIIDIDATLILGEIEII